MHKQKRLLLVFCPEDYFEVIFHKPVLIFTIGVSASGKSIWSKQIQAQYASLRIVIIERDAIRTSLP